RFTQLRYRLNTQRYAKLRDHLNLSKYESFHRCLAVKPEVNAGTTRGRSNSLVPYLDPNSDLRLALQSSRPVGRSQSMRLPSTSKSEKPKKLLRELTFSDDDTTSLRNYGTLRGKNSLPKRQSSALMKRVSTIQEEDSDRPKISPEVKAQLLNLMQELLVRGKITQIGIIDQDTASLILSLPAWNLSTADIIGLIKAAGNTQEIMLKLNIGREMYTCFKHGANKMVGRVGEKILVAQKTHTCVIVGIADHDTPGSCMYEVSELANALMEKDW
uniref:Profilin n=1 Tax=Biomphalaria glabrata TaxID=6526 RepID=A0A2C9M1E3_BIOGL